MGSKKYLTDYSLNYEPDKKGNLKAVPVYKGTYYGFEKDDATVRKAKWFITAMLICGTIVYIIPLLLEEVCTKKFYVLVPYALCVFPIFFAYGSLFKVIFAKEKVTREHKDKAQPRLKGMCFLSMLLAVLSLVGQVVFAINEVFSLKNVLVFVCTLLFVTCNFAAFRRSRDVAMKEKN